MSTYNIVMKNVINSSTYVKKNNQLSQKSEKSANFAKSEKSANFAKSEKVQISQKVKKVQISQKVKKWKCKFRKKWRKNAKFIRLLKDR